MSQVATACRWGAMVILALGTLFGQSETPTATIWRRLGQPSFSANLAGPATGSLAGVWYSPDGGLLSVKTSDGRAFQTADLDTWLQVSADRPPTDSVSPTRTPEPRAQLVTATGDSRRTWSVGNGVFVSNDGGNSWTTLSNNISALIGLGNHDVAVSPLAESTIAVVNDSGVWQTQDGGQTWVSLNERLPNLPIARIASVSDGRIEVTLKDGKELTLRNSQSPWEATGTESSLAAEVRERQRLSGILGIEISAWLRSSQFVYAGSIDGRVWVSRDGGVSWTPPQFVGKTAVVRFGVDNDAPRAVLAVLAGSGPRIFRTVNGGTVWDDLTGNLGDFGINAAAVSTGSGMAYVATDRGVFTARVDMDSFAPASDWTPLGGALPGSRVVDIAVEPKSGQLFAALDGFGLFSGPEPAQAGALRLLNAADRSTRAAAPGSLISVVGGKIVSANSAGFQYPVLAAGTSESQLQVPFESQPANLSLALTTATGTASIPLVVKAVSPSIFVDQTGAPFLVNTETGMTIDSTSAILPRTRLALMATGLGRVQPEWPAGVPAPADNPPNVIARVQAFLDGMPLEVIRGTLAPGYVGHYLVEVELPAIVNAGQPEFYLVVDGQRSNSVHISIAAQ